jgi:hypothetical protein
MYFGVDTIPNNGFILTESSPDNPEATWERDAERWSDGG